MNPADRAQDPARKANLDDRPEGWDYLTPEAMDEMGQYYAKESKESNGTTT